MAARIRLRRKATVVSLMLAASFLGLASVGCAPGDADPRQEETSAAGAVDAGQPDSTGGLASLSTRWHVDGFGWYQSDKPNLQPVFSEDGKYVVTSYPAVLDANTGDLLWEGQETDLQDFGEYGVSFTAPQGTFEMNPMGVISEETRELSDAEETEIILQLGQERLQADESVVDLQSDTDGRVPELTYVAGEVVVSKPGERTPAKTGDFMCGVYDSTQNQLVWAARVTSPVSPPMIRLLSEEAVIVNVLPPDGKLTASSVILTADGVNAIDGLAEALNANSFNWRGGSTAFYDGAGLGIDAAGRLFQFSMVLDNTTDVYLTDLSPDGTKVIYYNRTSSAPAGWGVADVR